MVGQRFNPCFKTGTILVGQGSTQRPITSTDEPQFMDALSGFRPPVAARAARYPYYSDITLGYTGSNYRAWLMVSVRNIAQNGKTLDPHRLTQEVSTAEFFFSVTAPTVEGLRHLLGMEHISYGNFTHQLHEVLVARYSADSLRYTRQQIGTTPRTTGPKASMNGIDEFAATLDRDIGSAMFFIDSTIPTIDPTEDPELATYATKACSLAMGWNPIGEGQIELSLWLRRAYHETQALVGLPAALDRLLLAPLLPHILTPSREQSA